MSTGGVARNSLLLPGLDETDHSVSWNDEDGWYSSVRTDECDDDEMNDKTLLLSEGHEKCGSTRRLIGLTNLRTHLSPKRRVRSSHLSLSPRGREGLSPLRATRRKERFGPDMRSLISSSPRLDELPLVEASDTTSVLDVIPEALDEPPVRESLMKAMKATFHSTSQLGDFLSKQVRGVEKRQFLPIESVCDSVTLQGEP